MGLPGGDAPGLKQSLYWIGHPFTAANCKKNLILWTRGEPAESAAHHTLPQKFEPHFTWAGIDSIHGPVALPQVGV